MGVLVSYCCFNKSQKFGGSKHHILFSPTLGLKSPTHVSLGYNRGVREAAVLLEAPGRTHFLALFRF